MSFPNIGNPPKTERNNALYAHRLAHPSEPWAVTGARFGISESMAHKVFDRVARRRAGGYGLPATAEQRRVWASRGGRAPRRS